LACSGSEEDRGTVVVSLVAWHVVVLKKIEEQLW
jgi:hypothetical protein